jgi:succinate-semialdehyde dehydrogenase/glutarate-semialdehyde dehydrogenase
MTYQSVNPFNVEILETFDELTDQQLETSLENAETCFKSWQHTSFAERAAVVAKAAAIMREQIKEFAQPVTLEMGKLIDQAWGEVQLSADILDYYAVNAERFLATEHLKPSSGEAIIVSTPKVKEQWGDLTDDKLDQIAGKRDTLVGKVQAKYGIAKEEAEKQVTDWEKLRS